VLVALVPFPRYPKSTMMKRTSRLRDVGSRRLSAIGIALVLSVLLGVVSAPVFAADVSFTDPKLEAAIRQAIGLPTQDIQDTDLSELTSLDARFVGITTLEGIQYCTNLTELKLFGNEIADISALAGLVNLTILYLDNNQISNIEALANLTNLTMLTLNNNKITDITALSGLVNLETLLTVGANEIVDIGPLANLTRLTRLDLAGNQIVDISALSNLANLTGLGLADNQIVDISALSGLTRLTQIWLANNQILDIDALVKNSAFAQGDSIDIRLNSLDSRPGSHDMLNVDELRSRGVLVNVDPQTSTDTVGIETVSSMHISWALILGIAGVLATIVAALLLF